MKYLLDTNVLIAMFRGREKVRRAILKAGFDNCCVSAVTLCEISTGCHLAGYEQHRHELEFVSEKFKILPVEPHAGRYGEIRADLTQKGTPIEDFDLIIAATAKDEGLTVVTHNTRHLDRVLGLKIIDWEKEPETITVNCLATMEALLADLNLLDLEIPQSTIDCLNVLKNKSIPSPAPKYDEKTFLRSGIEVRLFEDALKDIYDFFIVNNGSNKLNDTQCYMLSLVVNLFKDVLKALGQDGYVSCRSTPVIVKLK